MNATYYIAIKGLRLYAYHGVSEQERRVGNEFTVDVRLRVPSAHRAVESDCLDDTVNYADVAEIVRHEMSMPSRLLEHVAGRIQRAIVAQYADNVDGGEITISKIAPPIPAQLENVSFTIEW